MDTFSLKLIALATMIIDHIGIVFFPKHFFMRYIGRLSFPIYCFLLALRLKHTKNIKKYLLRLFIFAIISEPFYDLCFSNSINFFVKTNVLYTLFLGAFSIYIYNNLRYDILKFFCLIFFCFLASMLTTDYSSMGLILIYIFYFSTDLKYCVYYGLIWVLMKNINAFSNILYYLKLDVFPLLYIENTLFFSTFTFLSFLIISRYNGQKGKSLKLMFYLAYPLHLFILYIIKINL